MQRRLLAGACAGMAATLVSPVLGGLAVSLHVCAPGVHCGCCTLWVAQPTSAGITPPHHACLPLLLVPQLTYPLDTLRLRLAVDPNLRGVRGAVAVLLREGSGAAFYRGLGASMLGAQGRSHTGAAAASYPRPSASSAGWLWICAVVHSDTHTCSLQVAAPPGCHPPLLLLLPL